MIRMVRSELLKLRHSFSKKLILLAPLVTVLLGYILSGSYVQLSTYNWWYTLMLPLLVSVLSASVIIRERNTGMQNIICLPVSLVKIWFGKMVAVTLLLFVSNLFLWGISVGVGTITQMSVSPVNGMIGCILLFLTYLWQIPFIMLLTCFLGYLPVVILSIGANLFFSTVAAEKSWFFLDPYAIPARIVCPFFKMHPNGTSLENGSPLLDESYIIPALLISLLLVCVVLWIGSLLFLKDVRKHD